MQEIHRKLDNIAQVGTVTQIRAGKALAKVNILGRVTDFLPVKMIGNSFVKVWIPIAVGEQVIVISPQGDGNGGFIIPSILNQGAKEPSGASSNNAIVEIGDMRLECDGKAIKVDASNFKLGFDGNLTITGSLTQA